MKFHVYYSLQSLIWFVGIDRGLIFVPVAARKTIGEAQALVDEFQTDLKNGLVPKYEIDPAGN